MSAISKKATCPKCGEPLNRVSDRNGALVSLCLSDSCRQMRETEHRHNNPEAYLKQYGVPKRFWGCSLDTFEGGKKIVSACRQYINKQARGGIVFTGGCGCGKTHLSVAILRELVRHGLMRQAQFISVPRLLLEIKQSYDIADRSEAEILRHYSKMEFLILDDLGAEKTTEWAISILYMIIDARNVELMPTIYTTNLTLEQVSQQFSVRIASRLADCIIIQMDMPDYRRRR